MLKGLISLAARETRVAPDYEVGHCIAAKKTVGACSACRDVCPHEAITIGQRVVIDEISCSGCGLCIQACPSQALSVPEKIRPDGTIKCSRVSGDAQTVECLARLQPTDVLQLAGSHDKVTLARRDCETCPIGDGTVVPAIEAMLAELEVLLPFRARPLEVEVIETRKHAAPPRAPTSVSRRELFQLGFRGIQEGASEVLARVDFGGGDDDVPIELQRTYAWIAHAKPADDALVPWELPRIGSNCILCPVCTNVCPTHAFERELDGPEHGGGMRLRLAPDHCNACGACVASCPVHTITMDDTVTWGELRQKSAVAFERPPIGRRAPMTNSAMPTATSATATPHPTTRPTADASSTVDLPTPTD